MNRMKLRKKGNLKMRLIDADEIIKKWENVHCKDISFEMAVIGATNDVKNAPTVNALHVINCRECRWLKTNEFYTYCPITKHYGLDSNTYCCWAERKEHAVD